MNDNVETTGGWNQESNLVMIPVGRRGAWEFFARRMKKIKPTCQMFYCFIAEALMENNGGLIVNTSSSQVLC